MDRILNFLALKTSIHNALTSPALGFQIASLVLNKISLIVSLATVVNFGIAIFQFSPSKVVQFWTSWGPKSSTQMEYASRTFGFYLATVVFE
jgi:hypothetical protein